MNPTIPPFRWTAHEVDALIHAGIRILRIDESLGSLVIELATGDLSVIPAMHDRANVIGRPEVADAIRAFAERLARAEGGAA